MKIEVIDKAKICIFINKEYLGDIKFNSKEDIILVVKDFIVKYKKRLNLRGFYKVKVFANKRVGLFLEVNRLEDIELSNTVDLRVIVHLDDKVYFMTDDYEILPSENTDVYYYNNNFYCDVDNISDVLKVVEFGKFIYGEEVIDMLDNAIVI